MGTASDQGGVVEEGVSDTFKLSDTPSDFWGKRLKVHYLSAGQFLKSILFIFIRPVLAGEILFDKDVQVMGLARR